jgi:hypothetical protein
MPKSLFSKLALALNCGVMSALLIIPILSLATILNQPALAADSLARMSIDPTIAQKAPLIKCSYESQLDCIEKVYVEHKAGVIEEAKYIETRLVDFPAENNQKVQFGDILFDFHSGNPEGPIKRLRLSTNVITPASVFNGKKAGAYWITLQRELIPSDGKQPIDYLKCSINEPMQCLNYPALDTSDIFHVYLKTSWLAPVSASGEGTHFNIDYRRISGGIEWHLSGEEFLQPMFSDISKLTESVKQGNENMIPDRLNPTLYFALDHGGKDLSDSYWDPSCMSKGFTRTMWNAPMAGQLFWDKATNSLNFNMYAPHLDPFGNEYLGAFRTKFQKAWLDCRFPGNTLSSATKLTVQILDNNGVAQVATTNTSIKNGVVDISATGFHFSAPTIVVKRAVDSGVTNSQSQKYSDDWEADVQLTNSTVADRNSKLKPIATKSVTISCVKGKTTKRVTAPKPVCPKGFKKA